MRVSLIVFVFFMCGCKHLDFLFQPPATLKAIIKGNIKGVDIRCEKTLNLGRGKWEVMCKASDEIEIKYRTLKLDGERTKLEMMINKKKYGRKKVVAAPTLIVKRGRPAAVKTVSAKFDLDLRTEAVRP